MPRHGPGAVSDLATGRDKYAFPSWPKTLDSYFPEEYFAYPTERYALCNRNGPIGQTELPTGRLLDVMKDYDKPRLITSEPTAHQFLQQGLMRWIRRNLPNPLRHSIDFLSQEPSQALAKRSSRDLSLATVDLSAASDRLSLWTVERAFAKTPSLLASLYATRTPWIRDCTEGSDPDAPARRIRKFAGQGSACTFPVQSIIYTMACIAATLLSRGETVTKRNIRKAVKSIQVFGDDLILPKEAVPDLDLILSLLQLKINVGKTHYDGPFRESCGMDAFMGVDVTPIYMKAIRPEKKPESLTSWVDVCNNVHSAGLWHLSSFLDNCIPKKAAPLIPVSQHRLPCLTLRTFCTGKTFSILKTRTNSELQREEVLGLSPRSRQRKCQRGDYQALLQFFTEKPVHPVTGVPDMESKPWSEGYLIDSFSVLEKEWVRSS